MEPRGSPHWSQEQPAAGEPSIIGEVVEQWPESGAFTRERKRNLIAQFVTEVLAGSITMGRDIRAVLNARIVQIDQLISLQLNEVLHHPEFQRLEASWRGLWYLLGESEPGDGTHVRVLNVTKRDLMRDFQFAPSLEASVLFERLYDDGIGVLGGTPYGAIVGDYYFGNSGHDIELLTKIAAVAAAVHAPFLAAADASMFDLPSFTALARSRDVAAIFDSIEHTRWSSFRQSEQAKYVGLTLPRVLMREPYGAANALEAFDFDEHVDYEDDNKYLWGSAAYCLAFEILNAFARGAWFADICAAGGGGIVDGLPVHEVLTETHEAKRRGPTEGTIPVRREQELIEIGFIPLVRSVDSRDAVFHWTHTAHHAARELTRTGVTRRREPSFTDLRSVLCVSRFAQYIAVIWNSAAQRVADRSIVEALRVWLASYVHPAGEPGAHADPLRPLRQATLHSEGSTRDGRRRIIGLEAWPAFGLPDIGDSLRIRLTLPAVSTGAEDALEPHEDFASSLVPNAAPEATSAHHPSPAATEKPFRLSSLSPSDNPRDVLRVFVDALGPQASLLGHVAFGPFHLRAYVAAHLPLSVLADAAADGATRLQLDVTSELSGTPFTPDRLAFLAKYASGAVRGLSAEVMLAGDRIVLELLDPLAIVDPELLVELHPSAELRCDFDIVILEAPDDAG